MHQEIMPGHLYRILVVDDTAANLQLLTNLLTEHGYTVHPASDGELALEFVRSIVPDLILLDIRMPGMDGYEVCRRLKADERTRSVPIIFISILEDERDMVRGFQEGAVDYITKPVQPEVLLARVRTHLRLRELTEHLEQKVTERTAELHAANARLRTEISERKRMENSLRESEARLTEAQRIGRIGNWEWSVPDNKLWWSAETFRIFEIDPEKFGATFESFIKAVHPDDRERVQTSIRAAMQSDADAGAWRIGYRIPRKDGTVRFVQEEAETVFDQDGVPLKRLGTVQDITERKLAEEALRESRQRLDNIVANNPGAIYRCVNDAHWTMEFISAGITRISGYPAEDFLNNRVRSFAGIIHPDDRQSVVDAVATGLARKDRHEMEYRLVAADGTLRWVHEQGRGVFAPDGRLLCLDGVIFDITDQRKAEEMLKLNAERMEAMLRLNQMTGASLDELMSFAYEATIRLTRSKLGYLGLMNEDETALNIQLWSPEAMAECKVPDITRIFPLETAGLWGEAVRQRRPVITNDYAATNPWKKGLPEGHVGLTRHMNLPVIVGGKIVLVAGVGNKEEEYTETDVQQMTLLLEGMWRLIERKQAEEALRESERQKELILNSTAEMVTYYDPDLRVIWANRAVSNAFGKAAEEMVGLHCYEICHQSGEPCMGCPLLDARDAKAPRQREMENPEGRYRLVRGFPVIAESGQVTALVGFVQDITERKEAEKERERLQEQFLQAQKMEMVGRLAGGVAHDFNNMLSVVMGYAELALDKVAPDDSLRESLEEILAAGSRSAAITRQLLAFARKQPISPVVLDLNQTMESILKMLRRLIGEDINLTWMPGAELWPVKMDPAQLDQILANLCVNARDAIVGVGQVAIQTQNVACDEEYCADHADALPGEYVQLAVSDDGCGMDRETRHRLFEPFFTTKGVGKGTGLGLATVYGIVRQNNGFINVYSEPGHGSIFKIYLPRHAAGPEQVRRESSGAPGARGQETILLVEDDAGVLGLVKRTLESLGYRVLAAATSGEAVRLAKERSGEINLLLTDVIMPEMTGRDLAQDLTLLYPTLKKLFMSGYTGDIIAHRGVLDADINFIQKPFSRQMLATKVREVLDRE